MKPTGFTFFIMFLAATVAAFACFAFRVPVATEILIIAITLVVFYFVGLAVAGTVNKINNDVQRAADEITKQEMDEMLIDSSKNGENNEQKVVNSQLEENTENFDK